MTDSAMTLEQRIQRLEDIHAIANLKARYINGADGGWDFNQIPSNPDQIVPLFAEDGVWQSDSQGRAVGRESIRKAWAKFSSVMPFAVHWFTNPLIEVDGDEASGEWHFMTKAVDTKGVEYWSAGVYQDKFVRTHEGWRIKETRPRLIYLGPYRDGFKSLVEAANKFTAGEEMPAGWNQMHIKQDSPTP